jgi:transposase
MLLAYADGDTIAGVSRQFGVSRPKVQKLIDRVIHIGLAEALEDPRNVGRPTTITPQAQAWLLELASREPKELGYDSPWWTASLLARHGREHGLEHGHTCLGKLSHSTVGRIFARHGRRLHEIRYARPKGSRGEV